MEEKRYGVRRVVLVEEGPVPYRGDEVEHCDDIGHTGHERKMGKRPSDEEEKGVVKTDRGTRHDVARNGFVVEQLKVKEETGLYCPLMCAGIE